MLIFHGGQPEDATTVASSFKMASIRCIRGPVQRVSGSVATRIGIKSIGMHKQHIGILFPGEKNKLVVQKTA